MHRYDSSMVSRVRTDYLHPLQNILEAEYLRLNQVLVSEDSPTEKTKATKRLKELTKQTDELKKYGEVIHNLADQHIEIVYCIMRLTLMMGLSSITLSLRRCWRRFDVGRFRDDPDKPILRLVIYVLFNMRYNVI